METRYKYFGNMNDGDTADRPSGVIRSWVRPDGRIKAEAFTRSLKWETSQVFSAWYDDHLTLVEIDESVVERFIERLTRRVMAERDSSTS